MSARGCKSASLRASPGRVRGHVCFQIAKNDARTLMLYTGKATNVPADTLVLGLPDGVKRVWFALR